MHLLQHRAADMRGNTSRVIEVASHHAANPRRKEVGYLRPRHPRRIHKLEVFTDYLTYIPTGIGYISSVVVFVGQTSMDQFKAGAIQ